MSQPHPQPYLQPGHAPQGPQPKNGLGIASLILGIIGLLSGFIPILFGLAGTLGVVGLVLGLVGFSRARKRVATNGKTALAGVILSVLALVMAVVGVVITVNAVDDAVDDIDNALSSTTPGPTGAAPGQPSADAAADVSAVTCNPADGTTGWVSADMTVTNSDTAPRTYLVQVEWVDDAGTRLAEGSASTSSLAPGQSAPMTAQTVEAAEGATSCRVFDVSRF